MDKAQEGKLSNVQYNFRSHFDDTELAANEQEMEKVPEKRMSVRKAEAKTELKVKKLLAHQFSDLPRLS